MRTKQEGVLTYVQFHARMQRQDYQLSGRIARESNAAWTMGHADNKRHSRQCAFDAPLQRHYRHRRQIVFPKQYVMLKEDCIARAQINFRNRNDLAFDLTST